LLFNFVLEYAIQRAQEKQKGLKLNETHQGLACGDDVNIVRKEIDTVKKNTEALIDASKEVGIAVNPGNTKYMLMSRSQKIGRKRSIKIANRSFEDVTMFKYVGKTLTSKLNVQRD
jgi:hypothetical protein